MIKSMTGFGSATGEAAGRTFTVEIKSVNNRFREVITKVPRVLTPLEDQLKKLIGQRLERGRLDLWVQMDEKELKLQGLTIDRDTLGRITSLLSEIKKETGLTDPVTLSHLLSFNVIKVDDPEPVDLEQLWLNLSDYVNLALDGLIAMRAREGEALAVDLAGRIDKIETALQAVEKMLADSPKILFEKLKARLEELTQGLGLDPARLAQEAALLADKADLTEEAVRLRSHLDRFREILRQDEPAGRRLEFLLQEMGREVNTIGSKSQELAITSQVLDMKAELEKLREQVQNVE